MEKKAGNAKAHEMYRPRPTRNYRLPRPAFKNENLKQRKIDTRKLLLRVSKWKTLKKEKKNFALYSFLESFCPEL